MTALPSGSFRGVPFVKATAGGNDFIIIEAADAPQVTSDLSGLTLRICDRRRGVGADGVEWLFPSAEASVEARLFNSDGSAAEISGNGTRCVAAYWCGSDGKPLNSPRTISVLTGAGVKECRLLRYDGWEFLFETDMGVPRVSPAQKLSVTPATAAASGEVEGVAVSMGNPHFVVFLDESRLQAKENSELAESIAKTAVFPQGVNVELVAITDQSNITLRIFERGAGETLSSGTGACAAAAAAIATGRATSPVTVRSAGGWQTVAWEGTGGMVLSGPAKIVCRGEYLL